MGQVQTKVVLAGLGENRREGPRSDILELVNVQKEGLALLLGNVNSLHDHERKPRNNQRPQEVGVVLANLSLG